MANTLHKFTPEQRDALLAALRYYQLGCQHDPDHRGDDIADIATNGGAHSGLGYDEIDGLCEDINCTGGAQLLISLEGGLVSAVVSRDQALLGLDVLVVDYDATAEETQDVFVQQSDGEAPDVYAYWTGVERQTITILEDHVQCRSCVAVTPKSETIEDDGHYYCHECHEDVVKFEASEEVNVAAS